MAINLNIPTSWNALNDWQLIKIASALYSGKSKTTIDYKVFFALLDVRFWQLLKRRKALKVIRDISFSELKNHYQWLYNSLGLTSFVNSIKIKSKRFYGPADRISNLTINEFSHADDLYLGWCNTKDVEYLQYLAAVLYRQLNDNGKRAPFDKTELENNAKQFSKIDHRILVAVLLSYQGSRKYLISQFPLVFPLAKKTNNETPKSSGFGKITLHLSGGKFGNYNETSNTNVYTFLSDFSEQLKTKPYA